MLIAPPEHFPAHWAIAWGEDHYGYWQAFEVKGVRQVMRWISAGEFIMGSPKDEAKRSSDEMQHPVVIKQGFWLADTACTQALWVAVMGKNPSHFDKNNQNPVDTVSWNDCQRFIEKANQELPAEFQLRLPGEAEWEYSCRAGTQTPFSTGETLTTDQANYDGNYPYKKGEKKGKYREETVPVLSFPPNPLGLYQMHGNILEWCDDVYSEDYEPVGAGSRRVLRGGDWFDFAQGVRSALRSAYSPGLRDLSFGLRLAGGFDPQASKE